MIKTLLLFLILQNNDVYELAKIINAECAKCEMDEMLLIGSVVINRTKSKDFPRTIMGVIYQENQFHGICNTSFIVTEKSLSVAAELLIHGPVNKDILYFYLKNSKKSKAWTSKLKTVYKMKYHNFCILKP